MAKKAFCQHKSTKMISGVANYFSAPCTLLDTHPPPFQPPPQTLLATKDTRISRLKICSYHFYWCLCEEVLEWFAHLRRATTTITTTSNMANITEPRFYFHHRQQQQLQITHSSHKQRMKFWNFTFIQLFGAFHSPFLRLAVFYRSQFSTIKKLSNYHCLIVSE